MTIPISVSLLGSTSASFYLAFLFKAWFVRSKFWHSRLSSIFYERNYCSPKGEAWAAMIKFASLANTSIAGLPDFSKTKALSSVLLFKYLTASTMKFSYKCSRVLLIVTILRITKYYRVCSSAREWVAMPERRCPGCSPAGQRWPGAGGKKPQGGPHSLTQSPLFFLLLSALFLSELPDALFHLTLCLFVSSLWSWPLVQPTNFWKTGKSWEKKIKFNYVSA